MEFAQLPAAFQTPLEALTYEKAYAELEQIVAELEADNCSLEEALLLYERGQRLAKRCTELLDQADLRIQQLSGNTLADFELE